MIELQRAKLGLPPVATAAASAAAPGQAPATPSTTTMNNTHQQILQSPTHVAAAAPRLTPGQQAAAAVHAQEEQLQKFLHRLQRRQDEQASTVPTALSRRMLQRQGVGYLDESVASVVSATADRFLATVLQQAVACRDQRLSGAEMARQENRHRRKHILQRQADADDRKRRKVAREEARKKSNLDAVAAAEQLKARGMVPPNATMANASISGTKSKSKKKKMGEEKSDDETSYDSLEEEEDYYKEYYGGVNGDDSGEEEDENQDMLTLRDLERPLEAWGVHLTGKVGLGLVVGESSDVESDDEEEEEVQDVEMDGISEQKVDENGYDDTAQSSPAGKKADGSPASKRNTPNGPRNTPNGSRAKSPASSTKKAAGSKAASPVQNKT
jgi:hypothetical protein